MVQFDRRALIHQSNFKVELYLTALLAIKSADTLDAVVFYVSWLAH